MDDEYLSDDDDFIQSLSLSTDVQKAIASILPSDDPLDSPDFDLVEYINEIFPNEQSLSNIDEVIKTNRIKIK